MLSPKTVRAVVLVVCLLVSIPGMIVFSITDHIGAAMTFGIVAAVAALVLIVVTATHRPLVPPDRLEQTSPAAGAGDTEQRAAELEAAVESLVRAGVDEDAVRDVVRRAVDLGRRLP